MSKKELKQQNSDLNINVIDLIARFDPSKTNKFTKFLLNEARNFRESEKKLREREPIGWYVKPKSVNTFEQVILDYLHRVYSRENLEVLHTLHQHMENNRVGETGRDVNNYKNWEDIIRENSTAEIRYNQKRLEKEVIKVYEDDTWLVIRPLTFESSLTYGAGTKWCTASKSNRDYYYRYAYNGVLTYAINKTNSDKYGVFYDIHNNRSEFSVWNAPDVRIDSVESTIPSDVMKLIYKMAKEEKPNYEYMSDDEQERSGYKNAGMKSKSFEGEADMAMPVAGYEVEEMNVNVTMEEPVEWEDVAGDEMEMSEEPMDRDGVWITLENAPAWEVRRNDEPTIERVRDYVEQDEADVSPEVRRAVEEIRNMIPQLRERLQNYEGNTEEGEADATERWAG